MQFTLETKVNILLALSVVIVILLCIKLAKAMWGSENYGQCSECAKKFNTLAGTPHYSYLCDQYIPASRKDLRDGCKTFSKMSDENKQKYLNALDEYISGNSSFRATCEASDQLQDCNVSPAAADVTQQIVDKYYSIYNAANAKINDFQSGTSSMTYDQLAAEIAKVNTLLEGVIAIYSDYQKTGDADKVKAQLTVISYN